MKTYKWTCIGCDSPNIVCHDANKEGQIALNCHNCGTPGKFPERKENVVDYSDPVATSYASIGSIYYDQEPKGFK